VIDTDQIGLRGAPGKDCAQAICSCSTTLHVDGQPCLGLATKGGSHALDQHRPACAPDAGHSGAAPRTRASAIIRRTSISYCAGRTEQCSGMFTNFYPTAPAFQSWNAIFVPRKHGCKLRSLRTCVVVRSCNHRAVVTWPRLFGLNSRSGWCRLTAQAHVGPIAAARLPWKRPLDTAIVTASTCPRRDDPGVRPVIPGKQGQFRVGYKHSAPGRRSRQGRRGLYREGRWGRKSRRFMPQTRQIHISSICAAARCTPCKPDQASCDTLCPHQYRGCCRGQGEADKRYR